MGAEGLGLVGLAATFCASCADTPPPSPWIVSDSAGVEIVTTPAATLALTPAWSLDPEPMLELGTVADGGVTDFYDVTDVRFLPGERIVVANKGSEELRFFSLEGEHLHSAGRPGNGPREFDGLAMVRTRADSLVTYDGGNDRFSVRGPWGEYGRSFRLDWVSGILDPADVLGGTRILSVTARHMVQLQGTGIVVDTALVSLYGMEGHLVDSLVRLPHNARFVARSGDMQTTLGAPFRARGVLAGAGAGFCYAYGPLNELRCFGPDGALRRIARVEEPPRPVREADVEAFWEDVLARSERREYDRYLARFRETMPFPDHFSAFDRILTDDAGRVWVRRYAPLGDEPWTWWVFENGALIGTLETPRSLGLFDVRQGRVAGVWRDDFDVEHVRLYRLRDGGAASQ